MYSNVVSLMTGCDCVDLSVHEFRGMDSELELSAVLGDCGGVFQLVDSSDESLFLFSRELPQGFSLLLPPPIGQALSRWRFSVPSVPVLRSVSPRAFFSISLFSGGLAAH